MKTLSMLAIALSVLTLMALAASGETYTYVGDDDDYWHDLRNWEDPEGGHDIPGASDTAVIEPISGQSRVVRITNAQEVGQLIIYAAGNT